MPDISPLETAQSKDSQVNGKLKISIDFNRSSTPASNQYAVWIEDMDGNVVKTLFVTNLLPMEDMQSVKTAFLHGLLMLSPLIWTKHELMP